MKQQATDTDVQAFLAAVYPRGAALATLAFDERLVLQEATRQLLELREALQDIVDIGKRDLRNPKYDSYFETAKIALARQ